MKRNLQDTDIRNVGFLEILKETVSLFPERPAVIYNDKIYSYKYIWNSSLAFSEFLKNEASASVFTGICFRESPEYIQSFLSVWMAGQAFLMLDRNISNDRIMKYMQISDSFRILSDTPERFSDSAFRILCPSFTEKEINEKIPVFDPQRSAYAVCSSGSSGDPKVIHILHRGILNFLIQQIEIFQLNEKSRILMNTPLGFDASISETGVSLLSGAALCISSADLKNPQVLMKEAERMSVTHLYIPPSVLPFINKNMIPESLKTVFFGGEESGPKKVKELSERLRMINIYGPAETTVCASMKVCTADWEDQNIGKPIRNTEWILLEDDGKTSEKTGEICISGVGLAKGYIGHTELNELKFILHNDKIFYRTGDWAGKCSDGSYVFKGRKDRQWKRNGKLIEPAELEKTVSLIFPEIRVCVLPDRKKRPLLFLEMHKTDISFLRREISEILPSYFLPAAVFCIPEFPKNSNGKTDFSELLKMTDYPEKDQEKQNDIFSLAWKIGTGHFPSYELENFFESGGDSVSILGTALFLSENGFHLSVSDFYENPFFCSLKNLCSSESEQIWKTQYLEKISEDYIQKDLNNHDGKFQSEIRSVLVTGASGSLGTEICRILCTKYEVKTVGLFFRNRPEFTHPLFFPVQSDLRKDFLGLNKTVWDEFSESVDCIIHAGADVHLLKPLSALRDTNLGGLRNILNLLKSGKRKNLEYISTLGFFLNSDMKEKKIQEDLNFGGISEIAGGYSASKFISELILKKNIIGGAENIRIFRPGLLFKNKNRKEENDFFSRILKDAEEMHSFPFSDDYEADLTPAEVCAESICELIFISTSERVFHIANPNPFTLSDMAELAKQRNPSLRIENIENWSQNSDAEKFAGAGLSRLSYPEFYQKNCTLDIFRRTGFRFSLDNILKYSRNDSVTEFLSEKRK